MRWWVKIESSQVNGTALHASSTSRGSNSFFCLTRSNSRTPYTKHGGASASQWVDLYATSPSADTHGCSIPQGCSILWVCPFSCFWEFWWLVLKIQTCQWWVDENKQGLTRRRGLERVSWTFCSRWDSMLPAGWGAILNLPFGGVYKNVRQETEDKKGTLGT